ncbi:MAG: hypothetical protein ACI9YM_001270 [Brevundimonas sp.]|jgi:hypothetical protein|uniref:hypothetical protein n=1 Tax=Brevundimonas sp. TaxID=1871086 RepID=UPI0039E45EF3
MDHAMGERPSAETLDWLNDELLPHITEVLNSPKIRGRLGLYNGEVIPTNERNLTDSRNRVSLIYEYLLADVVSDLMADRNRDEFCAYVVANRFPDLEIRNSKGHRGLRLEVKCLQSTAEEKAANFSTLLKDVDLVKDYLVVFLWEWAYDKAEIEWDRAPLVLEAFAFHAQSLARLRDWYWLNRPSNNQGEAYQGYDLRTAITANNGTYKEEEGNFGKLLRIWNSSTVDKPPMDEVMLKTEKAYDRFLYLALHGGFKQLSHFVLASGVDHHEIRPLIDDGAVYGFSKGDIWLVLSSAITNKSLPILMNESDISDVFVFSDKYMWKHQRIVDGKLKTITSNEKPKHLAVYLNRPALD